ncbi:MAG: diguanylate cyclase [Phycisphaeraceae bacterium]|nr:diguanylate cyclase [Phycisphaeraceae bacterium]
MNIDDHKPLVLLIDDSVDVHRLLRARLKHEHINLVAASNADEAMVVLESATPATILLDLDMPGTDGFSLLRTLKDRTSTHSIPVIILSGLQGSEDKVTAFDLGAADYITKPFDMAELRARLRATLRLHHLLRLLADRADLDGLTGLGNRSHFNKRWAEKVSEAHRYKRPLSLALLDVDLFKRVNDTFGHPAGDEVLQGLAAMLLRECRRPDVACRFGGEEFALIMPSTSPSEAMVVAERVRVALAETVWPRHPDARVTVSVGIVGTGIGGGSQSPEVWIEAADRNLYTAKNAGRNRVVATSLDNPPAPQWAKAG